MNEEQQHRDAMEFHGREQAQIRRWQMGCLAMALVIAGVIGFGLVALIKLMVVVL